MKLLIEAGNAVVATVDGRITDDLENSDVVLRIPDGELLPGLINAHDHLHRNHYGRLGHPPYQDAYAWGEDVHVRDRETIERARAWPRRDALLYGAWKNLLSGVTTVVHHDRWEQDFESDFPLRVVRVRNGHSLGLEPELHEAIGSGPFFVHAAEGVDQRTADEIRLLQERGLLNEQLCAVHVVGADTEGVSMLRSVGAAVVWCPSSNLFLFNRTMPADLVAPGIDVMIGTDSLLTGAGSMLDELRVAASLGLLDERRLYAAVSEVPARRLGLESPSLAVGAPADVIVLRKPIGEATAEDVAVVVAGGLTRVLAPDLVTQLREHAGHGSRLDAFGVSRWVDQRVNVPRSTLQARLA